MTAALSLSARDRRLPSEAAPVAQWTERPPSKRRVAGSNPAGGASELGFCFDDCPASHSGLKFGLSSHTRTDHRLLERFGPEELRLTAALPEECLVDPGGSHRFPVCEDVLVALSLSDTRVPKHVASRLQVNVAIQHHCRRRVTEIM